MQPKVKIVREYISTPQKLVLAVVGTAAVFAGGFVSGIAAMMYEPDLPTMVGQVEVPKLIKQVHTEHVAQQPLVKESRWSYTSLKKEVKCLADNMYFEARNQSREGRIAVGLVTLNRVKSKHYPDSICDVVWQQDRDKNTGELVAQFSWTLDGKSDKIKNQEVYERIKLTAFAMVAGATLDNFYDFTDGATHYHADYVKPYWSEGEDVVAQVDDHLFYRP